MVKVPELLRRLAVVVAKMIAGIEIASATAT